MVPLYFGMKKALQYFLMVFFWLFFFSYYQKERKIWRLSTYESWTVLFLKSNINSVQQTVIYTFWSQAVYAHVAWWPLYRRWFCGLWLARAHGRVPEGDAGQLCFFVWILPLWLVNERCREYRLKICVSLLGSWSASVLISLSDASKKS